MKLEFRVTTSILGTWPILSYKQAGVAFQFLEKMCYSVLNWQDLIRVGFLSLLATGILSQTCPVCCRMT